MCTCVCVCTRNISNHYMLHVMHAHTHTHTCVTLETKQSNHAHSLLIFMRGRVRTHTHMGARHGGNCSGNFTPFVIRICTFPGMVMVMMMRIKGGVIVHYKVRGNGNYCRFGMVEICDDIVTWMFVKINNIQTFNEVGFTNFKASMLVNKFKKIWTYSDY